MISKLASLDVRRISQNFTECFDRWGLSINTVSSVALLPFSPDKSCRFNRSMQHHVS